MNPNFIRAFENQYFKGRNSLNKRLIHTIKGLIYRSFRNKNHIEELKITEALRAEYGMKYLENSVTENHTSIQDLKIYKTGLKTINAKLKHRNDFLTLAAATLAASGLTSFKEHSNILSLINAPDFFITLMIVFVSIIAIERVSVMAIISENEEIINIIDSMPPSQNNSLDK
ncbi:hypothetical protein K5D36_24745 [Pseudomonas cichorii]|nr:hypothetical protein [Pseudomonas cichorii]